MSQNNTIIVELVLEYMEWWGLRFNAIYKYVGVLVLKTELLSSHFQLLILLYQYVII